MEKKIFILNHFLRSKMDKNSARFHEVLSFGGDHFSFQFLIKGHPEKQILSSDSALETTGMGFKRRRNYLLDWFLIR